MIYKTDERDRMGRQIPTLMADMRIAQLERENASLLAELADAKRDLRLCSGHDTVAKFKMLVAERDSAQAQVAAIRAERDSLSAALRSLIDKPLLYVGDRIEIVCDSHGHAIGTVAAARSVLKGSPLPQPGQTTTESKP